MAAADFQRWWTFCQAPDNDGRASDNAVDNRGQPDGAGTTRWGWTLLTWRSARHYLREADLSEEAFLSATEADMERLAKGWFWGRLLCDLMLAGTDIMVADWSFTSGLAVHEIQRILGTVSDGVIGPQTLRAISGRGAVWFIDNCLDWRKAYYDRCGLRPRFPGLYRRADQCAALARSLAGSVPTDEPQPAGTAGPSSEAP